MLQFSCNFSALKKCHIYFGLISEQNTKFQWLLLANRTGRDRSQ